MLLPLNRFSVYVLMPADFMAIDVIRAWKDGEYRKTLTPEELAGLPNPADVPGLELSDEELQALSAGLLATRNPTKF